jgi:hypothetical protein
MSLINFEVIAASVAKAQLLVALEQVIPAQTIHRAIINTSSQERREGILPTHVVVA